MTVGAIRVSVVDLVFDDPSVPVLLDDGETARAQRFTRPVDRLRFTRARTAFKVVLAEAAGVAPGEVAVVQRCRRCGGPHGRPVAAAADRAGLRYSLAHAGNLAAVAVADGGEVGVDIEVPVRLAIPAPACTREELRRLSRMTPADAAAAFLRLWVRKEAYAKAVGEGLDLPFDLVVLAGDGTAKAPAHPGLVLSDFEVDGNPLAVAAPGHPVTLERHRLGAGARLVAPAG
ncbi:MAG: 4'-phosphopantetheinyl transferase superfamily protein [Actinomycetota bacterium]|nr:4'-phosphopantetheinyl transferase superfamily protein [Actinomycetota bacterium]